MAATDAGSSQVPIGADLQHPRCGPGFGRHQRQHRRQHRLRNASSVTVTPLPPARRPLPAHWSPFAGRTDPRAREPSPEARPTPPAERPPDRALIESHSVTREHIQPWAPARYLDHHVFWVHVRPRPPPHHRRIRRIHQFVQRVPRGGAVGLVQVPVGAGGPAPAAAEFGRVQLVVRAPIRPLRCGHATRSGGLHVARRTRRSGRRCQRRP